MKIFYMEDTPEVRQSLQAKLERSFSGAVIVGNEKAFAEAIQEIGQHLPDIVILDMYEGNRSHPENKHGHSVCDIIWKESFRPIIIFTAAEDTSDLEIYLGNPFFKIIKKGQVGPNDSLEQIVTAIKYFAPLVSEISKLELEIVSSINSSVRKTAEFARSHTENETELAELIAKCARRRIAATFDEDALTTKLPPFSRYVIPPIGESLAFGDILFESSKPKDDPNSYVVVLSPSCDLVSENGRSPKINKVLVGQCVGIKHMLKEWQLPKNSSAEQKLIGFLNQPQLNGYLCIPGVPKIFPNLGLNLRDVKQLEFSDIAPGKSYSRIASIDSPFRESISWGFLQIHSRPGVPDVDFSSFSKELIGIHMES